jgi:hypothetical protein
MKSRLGSMLLLIACGLTAFGTEKDTLEQLIARAESASTSQQPDLYLEIADRESKLAVDAYKSNKLDDGHKALEQTVSYADKAHANVLKSGKKLPRTEIKIRRLVARFRDLKQNVDADEQAGVQAAVDKLESFRTDLLKAMFGSKNAENK